MSMSEEEWGRWSELARDRMARHVYPFVTPISLSVMEERGSALGTGNYVRIFGATYLLTNDHVIREGVGAHLGHLPGPTDEYVRMMHTIITASWPIELALMRLGEEWNRATKAAVPVSRFDRRYAPVDGELLFWVGFPGTTATRLETPIEGIHSKYTWHGAPMENEAVPVLTQAFRGDPGPLQSYDPAHHVVVDYPARARKTAGGPLADVPNPKGMSGSLLLDTKFVACANAGIPWSPDRARICGLLWAAHPRPEVVVATRVEHLRPVLLHWIREERGFLHWLDRDRPLWQEMVDWTWAEERFSSLEDGE